MTIAYDCKLIRPGCAILQAILGGSPGIANKFSSESWLVHPTPDMKVYQVTDEQLKNLIRITNAAQKIAPKTPETAA